MVAPTYVGVQIVPFSGIVRKVPVGTAVCSDEVTNVAKLHGKLLSYFTYIDCSVSFFYFELNQTVPKLFFVRERLISAVLTSNIWTTCIYFYVHDILLSIGPQSTHLIGQTLCIIIPISQVEKLRYNKIKYITPAI